MKNLFVAVASCFVLVTPLAMAHELAKAPAAEPAKTVEAVEITKEVDVPVYIEVPVETVKTVEVIREMEKTKTVRVVDTRVEKETIIQQLTDWNNLEELREFLAEDDTDSVLILTADKNGLVSFRGQCEDFAIQLRDRAMAEGKYLSVIALHPEEYLKWYGSKTTDYHAICMARIGNELYYIEPSNDRVWLALYLD